MKLAKATEFVGVASGDGECFCFDRLTSEARAEIDRRAREMDEWPTGFDPDADRIYPSELLPSGVDGKRGRWVVTVEFTPEGE